jgi:hypothetical protein
VEKRPLTETAHCDGTYETPDRTERSLFTLHLYLNDTEGKNGERQLEGGATTFFSWNMNERLDVVPKVGRVLIFQHRNLLHSGDDVISGTKLTLRTDIMYTLAEDMAAEPEAEVQKADDSGKPRKYRYVSKRGNASR